MAEPDSDPRNTVEDEDLEDGEIETDEEVDDVNEAKAAKPAAGEPAKKAGKMSEDESKKASDAKSKTEHRKSTPENNATKSKKAAQNDAVAKDDWMGDVEKAIAMALKKDGIAPKAVKINSKPPKEAKEEPKEAKESKAEASSSGKSSKHKRKHKADKDMQRKKAKLAEEDGERVYHSNESEEFDDYEMMNVRGGSPPSHGGPASGSQKQMYYDSDASYESFDSETGDHRRRNRSKRRANDRNSRRNHRGGNSKRDHKRRRDESGDENVGHSNNAGNNRGNNNNQPRKAELCKFYLMECCAKGEKCLYMHGDFPCKFYYLGMKNHNRENCKFSHGKPLTDQLRAVLLKHLETAPKEILGDFPRIARENAINMINAQHQKLLVKFGMEPEPSTNASNSSAQASKLPSLLDINFSKFQPPSEMMNMGNSKKDKPRKSRWCDQRSNDSDLSSSHPPQHNNTHSSQSASSTSNENDIKLSTLTGTLTAEQVDKLAQMGIETISQVTQLTVLQVIELGLSIALISELQLKASQLQQSKQKSQSKKQQPQQQSSQSSKPPTENKNPFSQKLNQEVASRDQDMRLPPHKSNAVSDSLVEQTNQDVDMRILPIAHQAASSGHDQANFKKHDKNTHSEKATRKPIDYSQYLKDANVDLNQSDLEEPTSEASHKEKRKGYDSDEDEANPLVIEEDESLHIEEPHSENEDDDDLKLDAKSLNDDPREPNSEMDSSPRNADLTSNSLPSPDSDSANANDDHILPAFYAPSSIFPSSVTNKIDLSSSVSQYLKKTTLNKESVQKTDNYLTKAENELASDPQEDNESTGSQSPSTRATSFYSRQIPETNHPAPQALDEKPSPSMDYDSSTETNNRNNCSSPVPVKPLRKSIYEMSSDDENDQDDDNIRSPSDDDNDSDARKQNTFALSKDKDMRIPAIFMDKDYSNGDIDLRLPFKPVMANYIPATEIDASITSHAPITYEVKEVDIPKPDYSELRKSIPTHENTLDPRLRRILRIKEDYTEPEPSFPLSAKASPFSPPHEPEPPMAKLDPISDPRRQRADPRRPNAHLSNSNAMSNAAAPVLNKPSSSQPQRSHLDIQNILQKSNWYKDLSSKQKIMVNQQLAIVSTELKKFHADQSDNKIFDLKFINQNNLLQEVLTNLGIYINEDGEFIQFDQPNLSSKDMQSRSSAASAQGLVDLMSIPMDIDYLRNQQQQQEAQQQQAALINAMGPRFLGAPPSSQMLGFGSIPGDVIRPGLLGIAPNMPLNEAFNLMQNAGQNAAFFNRGSGGSGNSNNRRTGGGMRRNQFDRNNLRREKPK